MRHYGKKSDIGTVTEGYKRIDKREARRLYESGKCALVITPSRVNRLEMWASPATKLISKNFQGDDFDGIIKDYEAAFCYDIETTGDYTKFYVKVAPSKKGARA